FLGAGGGAAGVRKVPGSVGGYGGQPTRAGEPGFARCQIVLTGLVWSGAGGCHAPAQALHVRLDAFQVLVGTIGIRLVQKAMKAPKIAVQFHLDKLVPERRRFLLKSGCVGKLAKKMAFALGE